MVPSLNNQWIALEEEKKRFEDIVLKASLPQQQYFVSKDSWNMLQVMAHIIAVEKTSFGSLISKNYSNARKSKGKLHFLASFLLRLMLRSRFRFKVPPIPALLPSNEKALEDLLEEWQNERRKIADYLKKFPEDKLNHLIFRHPTAGWLTIGQTLNFLTGHIRHHHHQINRIKRSSGFPQ